MSRVIYNYRFPEQISFGGGPKEQIGKTRTVILVNCQVKLVVIDNNYESDGNVIDSSLTFFNENIVIKGDSKEANLFIDLDESMIESTNFKSFWAKWSSKCGERGYPSEDFESGINGPYFGLQIIQTFKGDASYAGFSHTDYLFVPFFNNRGNSCDRKDCSSPSFTFWDTTSDTIDVRGLKFDTQAIVEKQLKVADQKINFEQELKNYQAQLVAQSDELILSTYDYQPTNFVNVITRLLEFKQGTLISSLDFAENANLTQLYNLLGPTTGIENEIESLAGLYPSITIEDGEGIPYGDGIPGIYSFFGWGFNNSERDIFSVVNKDRTSLTNFGIVTRNNVQILNTTSFAANLSSYNYFIPEDYISWGNNAGFDKGDIIECTITVTDYVDETVNFVKSNFGFETDVVSSGVTITRNGEGGIYNSNVESEWDAGLSPSGTTWNSQGWAGLPTVNTRDFTTFFDAIGNELSSESIVGRELVMYDETTDEYWAIKFTSWTNADKGGAFEYNRRLINQAGTLRTFKDTLVWKG